MEKSKTRWVGSSVIAYSGEYRPAERQPRIPLPSVLDGIRQIPVYHESLLNQYSAIYGSITENSDAGMIRGRFCELHLHQMLRGLQQAFPREVNIRPFRIAPDSSYQFQFPHEGALNIRAMKEEQPVAEYDAVTAFRNTDRTASIVVWEAKMAKSMQTYTDALNVERISARLQPVKDYFQTDAIGYILCVPSDVGEKDISEGTAFAETGYLVTPISMTYADFSLRTQEAVENHLAFQRTLPY